ncbi:MAG: hypothetical protein M1824_005254 [Vezdaea acicularis]|nr:MAG: hypothetical protein M1824_005254 [Vezdaea acicularis]
MPALTSYTHLESLLLFQSLQSYGTEPAAFNKISERLQNNGLIRTSKDFDVGRLNADALRDLYQGLLKQEVQLESARIENGIANRLYEEGDGGLPGSKKRKAPSPSQPSTQELMHNPNFLPQLVARLYARYRESVIKEIYADERKYKNLQREVREIEQGEWDDSQESLREELLMQTPRPHNRDLGPQLHIAAGQQQNTPNVGDTVRSQSGSKAGVASNQTYSGRAANFSNPESITSRSLPGNETVPLTQGSRISTALRERTDEKAWDDLNGRSTSGLATTSSLSQQYLTGASLLSPNSSSLRGVRRSISPGPQLIGLGSASLRSPKNVTPAPPPSGSSFPSQIVGAPDSSSNFQLSEPSRPNNLPPIVGIRDAFPSAPNTMDPLYPTVLRGPHVQGTTPSPAQPQSILPQSFIPVSSTTAHSLYPSASAAQSPLNTPTPNRKQYTSIQVHQNEALTPEKHVPSNPPLQFHQHTSGPLSRMSSQPNPFTPSMLSRNTHRPPPLDTSATKWKPSPNSRPEVLPPPPIASPLSDGQSPIREFPTTASRATETKTQQAQYARVTAESDSHKSRGMRRGRPSSRVGRGRGRSASTSVTGTSLRGRSRSQSTYSNIDGIYVDYDNAAKRIKREQPQSPSGFDLDEGDEPAKRAHKRKRSIRDTPEISDAPESSGPRLIFSTRNFSRTTATILNDISGHRFASIFAKPLTEKNAPGYKELIYRPQDLKSIKSAITAGGRAVAAYAGSSATPSESFDSPGPGGATPSKNAPVWMPPNVDIVPPKGIVNSSQLEKEVVRMFANAIMYNADENKGFSSAFKNDEEEDGEEDTLPAHYEMSAGVITETREMFEAVEQMMANWRAVEGVSGKPQLERERPGLDLERFDTEELLDDDGNGGLAKRRRRA